MATKCISEVGPSRSVRRKFLDITSNARIILNNRPIISSSRLTQPNIASEELLYCNHRRSKKVGRQEVAIFRQKFEISQRGNYVCSKCEFCRKISPKRKFSATNFAFLKQNFLTRRFFLLSKIQGEALRWYDATGCIILASLKFSMTKCMRH